MDTQQTITQVSGSVEVTGGVGVAAGTAEFVDTRKMTISSSAGPIVTATTSEFGDDDIGSFFERPVLINTFTWPSTVTSGTQIQNMDPWYLYLTNTSVARKTANYYKFSGTLVLDVVLQAAPTQYGHAIVQLIPQGVESYGEPYTVGGALHALDILPNMYQSTQDMYGDLCPATSETLEFRLPWISTQDSIELGALSTTGPLGGGPQTQWRFLTHCVVSLSNATNAASVGNVTVRVYARVEGAKLSIPIVLQAKERGKVGRFAGGIAHAAGILKSVPLVGEFAAGVEVVASAVASVADWFGFTRTNLLENPTVVRQRLVPGMPNADGVDTGTTLSLLRENKVSVDPNLFGSGGGVDVESFADLFRRKTLYSLTTWTTSAAAGTVLATVPVTPFLCNINGGYAYMTPAGFTGLAFANWRGPMYFEIQVRCSSLHRGMLQIAYHPSNNHDASDPTNTSYNRVFEISTEGSHTFYVGWSQNRLMASCPTQPQTYAGTDGLLLNGWFDIRVFTVLTAPDPAASVTVEVYSFTDGNMVFTNPHTIATNLHLEAGEATEMTGAMYTEVIPLVGDPGDDTGDLTSIVAGERIQSLRTLLQRPYFQSTLVLNIPSAGYMAFQLLYWFTYFNVEFPWNPTSFTPSPGTVALSWTPLSWFPMMFLGWRGTVRRKFVFNAANSNLTLAAAINTSTPIIVGGFAAHVPTVVPQHVQFPDDPTNSMPGSIAGCQEFDPKLGSVLEVNIPYYKHWRYNLTRLCADYSALPGTTDGICVGLRMYSVDTAGANTSLGYIYQSAGSDFTLGRFRFVPRIHIT